ncbi:unnamed protein product, partial [Ectocarpus sp. 12 AP-2014]
MKKHKLAVFCFSKTNVRNRSTGTKAFSDPLNSFGHMHTKKILMKHKTFSPPTRPHQNSMRLSGLVCACMAMVHVSPLLPECWGIPPTENVTRTNQKNILAVKPFR